MPSKSSDNDDGKNMKVNKKETTITTNTTNTNTTDKKKTNSKKSSDNNKVEISTNDVVNSSKSGDSKTTATAMTKDPPSPITSTIAATPTSNNDKEKEKKNENTNDNDIGNDEEEEEETLEAKAIIDAETEATTTAALIKESDKEGTAEVTKESVTGTTSSFAPTIATADPSDNDVNTDMTKENRTVAVIDASKIKKNDSGVKVKTEDSSMHVESSEQKETEKNNRNEDGDGDEMKSVLASADATALAVAEDMIKTVHERKKNINKGHAKKDSDAPPSRALAANYVNSTSMTSKQPTLATAPKAYPKVSLAARRNTQKQNKTVISNKGKEPSDLEFALKQQGITQSDQLRSTQFPFRLHNMLDDAERSDHAHIVSWCAGGDSFKIHQPPKLINVLQKYFRQSKFKSFLRQLQGYNFNRITRGKDQGVVSHPLFLRGRRSMSTLALMKRKRVRPKVIIDKEHAKDAATFVAATAAANLLPANKHPMNNQGTGAMYGATNNKNIRIRPTVQQQQHIPRGSLPSIHPVPTHLNNVGALGNKRPSQSPATTMMMMMMINPDPHDVLCVDVPNILHFQGNRKLSSIVKKITGHYTTANESVKTMIVNEISSRIQKGGSRFLKLGEDGMTWMECNKEEMFRKVISCFELETQGTTDKNHVDLSGGTPNTMAGTTYAAASVDRLKTTLPGMGNRNSHSFGTSSDPGRRLQEPPRDQDVVLRGGPTSEKEGNTYLITMIQANVGHQVDAFEMKRIKCRAILERMKRRGTRFFLKLNETDSDDDLYILSDAEAQDVIYTAFCAEEKKIQSLLIDTPAASSMLRRQSLSGLDGSQPGVSTASRFGGASQYGSRALQSDAALLSQLKTNSGMGMLSSQAAQASYLTSRSAGEKRPLESHDNIHEDIIEKRLRAETDEHMKMLIERARQQRNDPYGANLTGRLPFDSRRAGVDSSLPLSAYGSSSSSSMDQYLKERHADEMRLQSAAAQSQFGAAPPSIMRELPKSNNHFVEFLKKKYVKNQERPTW